MRDQFKGHDHYEYTAQFCHLYDQCAFDPNYESMSLEDFEMMVHRVLSKPKINHKHIKIIKMPLVKLSSKLAWTAAFLLTAIIYSFADRQLHQL